MANSDSPLLLTKPGSLNHYTAADLRSQGDWVDNALVFGGMSSPSVTIVTEVSAALFN